MIKQVEFRMPAMRRGYHLVTHIIEKELGQLPKQGLLNLFIQHSSAGLTINENADPSVRRDILYELEKVVPEEDDYAHTEGNSAAHIKASLLGFSVTIFVEGSHLLLGTWQGIYFAEFDGPRSRNVLMKIMQE